MRLGEKDWSKLAPEARGLVKKLGLGGAAKKLGVSKSALRSGLARNPSARLVQPVSGSVQPRLEGGGGGSRGVGGEGAHGSTNTARDVRLILPDAHIPAHHVKAFATMNAIAKELNPTRLIIMGDWVDVLSLSRHPKRDPGVVRFEDETDAAERELDKVCDATSSAEKYLLQGNHDARSEAYEAEIPELEGALSIPKRLKLAEKRVRWVPLAEQDETFEIDGTGYLHGVFEGVNAARQHAEILGPKVGIRRIVFAHCHSAQSWTTASGFSARCCMFLGNEKHKAFSYRKGRPSPWVLGFLIEEVYRNAVTYTEVRIDPKTGRAVFRGEVYDGRAA
jgi:predicted phosphodiesterase